MILADAASTWSLVAVFGALALALAGQITVWMTMRSSQKRDITINTGWVEKKTFEKLEKENREEHDKIFSKIGGVERGVESRLNAKLDLISLSVTGLSTKMQEDKTEILDKGEQRATHTHDRINVLVEKVGQLSGRIDERLNQ